MARKTKSKGPKIKLDLSHDIVASESRKIQDYDYDLIQNANSDKEFENDLDYLLDSVDNEIQGTAHTKEPIGSDQMHGSENVASDTINREVPNRKPKKFKVRLCDITKDIDDIYFSSDSEDEVNMKKSIRKKKVTKKNAQRDNRDEDKTMSVNNSDINNTDSSELEEIKQRKKEKRRRKDQRRKLRKAKQQEGNNELATDQTELLRDADGNTTQPPSQKSVEKKDIYKSKKVNLEKNTEVIESNDATDKVVENDLKINEIEVMEALDREEQEIDSALNESLKKLKRKDRNKKKKAKDNNNNTELTSSPTRLSNKNDDILTVGEVNDKKVVDKDYSICDEKANLTRKQRNHLHHEGLLKLGTSQDKPNAFDVSLKQNTQKCVNKKFMESCPAVQCIKTIIGLSHQQILSLPLSDVKIKTIVSSSSISKFSHHVLKFVIKYSHSLFADEEKKHTFFKLCTNVALYESSGFKRTVQHCLHVLEWFGDYDELTLEQTHTKLTPSNKNVHQNNFDYSVLAYVGHILIWAAYQQRQSHHPTLFNKYNLKLTFSDIEKNIGGFHLWDRLRKMPETMNAKRWKHIVKFRQAFAYEEDQFMLILRFMDVDSTIP